jgi:hypothetical protein
VLGVMSDGKCIRGVPVPSCVVMWVTWQLDTWRSGAIICCDVGDMVIGYVAYRYVVYRYMAYRYMRVDRWNLSEKGVPSIGESGMWKWFTNRQTSSGAKHF